MSDSLASLDKHRGEIQRRIAELGDMRSGSISKTGGRCGNPRCHCHRQDDPGHGPYYRLTKKVNGKTVTETFSSAAGLRKAQREVEAFHRFKIAQNLAVTTSVQYLVDPAFNPNDDEIWLFGLRVRLTF